MNNIELNTSFEDNKKDSSVIENLIDSLLNGNNYLLISWERIYQRTILLELSKRINYPVIFISPLKTVLREDAAELKRWTDKFIFIAGPKDLSIHTENAGGIKAGKFKILFLPAQLLNDSSVLNFIKSLNQIYVFIDEAEILSEGGDYSNQISKSVQEFIKFTKIGGLVSFSSKLDNDLYVDIKFKLRKFNLAVKLLGLSLKNIHFNVLFSTRKEMELKSLLDSGNVRFPIHLFGTEDDSVFNEEKFQSYSKNRSQNRIDFNVENFNIKGNNTESLSPYVIRHSPVTLNRYLMNPGFLIIYSLPDSLEEIIYMLLRYCGGSAESIIYIFFDLREKIKKELQLQKDLVTPAKIMQILNLMRQTSRTSKGFREKELISIDRNFYTVLVKNKISQKLFQETVQILIKSNHLIQDISPAKKVYIRILLKEEEFEGYINFVISYSLKNLLLLIRQIGKEQIFSSSIGIQLVELLFGSGLRSYQIFNLLENLKETGVIEFEQDSSPDLFIFNKSDANSRLLDFQNQQFNLISGSRKEKFDNLTAFILNRNCRVNLFYKNITQNKIEIPCGKCDNCKGRKIPYSQADLYLRESILKTLIEGRDKLSHQRIFQILTGEPGSEINKKYSSYGSNPSLTSDKFNSVLSELIREDLVKNVRDELILTPVGKGFNTGEINDEKKTEKIGNYESDLLLFNQLRQVRKEASIKFAQAPEIICPDKILKKITNLKPRNINDLFEVTGFTQRMFNKIGLELMSILSKLPDEGKNSSTKEMVLEKQFQKTLEMVTKGYLLSDIARILRVPESLAAFQIESIISYYPAIDINSLIPRKELKMIEEELLREDLELKSLKRKLPNNMSYAKIRIVLAKWKVSHSH